MVIPQSGAILEQGSALIFILVPHYEIHVRLAKKVFSRLMQNKPIGKLYYIKGVDENGF